MDNENPEVLPKQENANPQNGRKILGIAAMAIGVILLILAMRKKDEKLPLVINVNNGEKTPKKKTTPKKKKAKKDETNDSENEGDDDTEDSDELSSQLSEDDNSDDNTEGEK